MAIRTETPEQTLWREAARIKVHPTAEVDYGLPGVRPTLIERSIKRLDAVERVGPGSYYVAGDPGKGDTYEEYRVTCADRWFCSCQDHVGGEYRGLCSHIVACMIFQARPQINWDPPPEDMSWRWPEVDDRPRIVFGDGGPELWADEPIKPVETMSAWQADVPAEGAPAEWPAELTHDPLKSLRLPAWAPSLRPHQEEALRAIYAAMMAGKKCIIVEAPTGAGKTLIGECAAQMIGARAIYVCTTKSLQQQFLSDFPEAQMIKGRVNYPTQNNSFPEWTCEDCDWKKERGCSYCYDRGSCPYQVAKRQAERASLAVANTAYYLAMSNGPAKIDNVPGTYGHDENCGKSFGLKGRGLAIFDEADELENVLLGWVEFRVGARILRDLSADPELEQKGGELTIRQPIPPLPDPLKSRWPERIRWLKAVAGEALRLYEKAAKEQAERAMKRWWKVYEQAQWVVEDIEQTRAECDENQEPWVYDVENGAALFKPVRVAKYGARIFDHAHINLIISATIVAPEQFAEDLGIAPADMEFIRVNCAFPKQRRPLFALPCANVTAKERDKAYPALVARIKKLVREFPVRTLIHTVSYDLARYLHEELRPLKDEGFKLITYASSAERDWALEQLRGHPRGILLAPSMERGINLKGDDCRSVIVAKVPWPNMGDKRVKRRKYQPTPRAGDLWYKIQTLRAIIQMTGRGMRSADDWCRTWILDEQFLRLWRECKSLLPLWWREAVQTDTRDPIAFYGIDREGL